MKFMDRLKERVNKEHIEKPSDLKEIIVVNYLSSMFKMRY